MEEVQLAGAPDNVARALLVALLVPASGCATTLTGSQIPDPAVAREHVTVHIDSNAPVTLRRHVRAGSYDICHAPCDSTLAVDSAEGDRFEMGRPTDSFEVTGSFPATP